MPSFLNPPAEGFLLVLEPPVGWLVIDRPARRNAITRAMWAALPEAVAQLAGHREVKVVILKGGGTQTFIAGADISEFGQVRNNRETSREYERLNEEAFAALRDAPLPTMAMIRGHCLGGGMALALACDLRVAEKEAQFGIPAAKLGVGYPPQSIADLVGVVGPSLAKDIFYTARRLPAEEAHRTGLVNRVFPTDELEAQTIALAHSIAENAPLTQRAAKAAINALVRADFGSNATTVQHLCDRCFDSEDFTEGRSAFAEKRTPVFRGV